jgi:hypothetical protein
VCQSVDEEDKAEVETELEEEGRWVVGIVRGRIRRRIREIRAGARGDRLLKTEGGGRSRRHLGALVWLTLARRRWIEEGSCKRRKRPLA